MVMQAYAIETSIQALRRNRPYCMGSLYWQINDVWPVYSWASVDFYGQWKALHYRGREAYKDIVSFITALDNSGSFKLHLINEQLRDVYVKAQIDVMLFNGTVLGQFTFDQAMVPGNNRRSDVVHILLPLPLDLNSTYVRASIFNYTTG